MSSNFFINQLMHFQLQQIRLSISVCANKSSSWKYIRINLGQHLIEIISKHDFKLNCFKFIHFHSNNNMNGFIFHYTNTFKWIEKITTFFRMLLFNMFTSHFWTIQLLFVSEKHLSDISSCLYQLNVCLYDQKIFVFAIFVHYKN